MRRRNKKIENKRRTLNNKKKLWKRLLIAFFAGFAKFKKC
jgi:hypothetical protein